MADARPPFEVLRPASPRLPVVVHAPHGSRTIPDEVRGDLLLDAQGLEVELLRMTDHLTDGFAEELVDGLGVVAFVNRLSRLVVDPERFVEPDAEEMEKVGMGAVYTATHDRQPLRRPDPAARNELLERHFHPYAAALAACVSEVVEQHGRCLLVDLHSYPSRRLPYELHGDGPRPEVCIGTDPFHTPEAVASAIASAAERAGLSTARDTPFEGTYVPLRFYRTDARVGSVMIELRRDSHLDEETGEPTAGRARVAAFLADAVTQAAHAAPSEAAGRGGSSPHR